LPNSSADFLLTSTEVPLGGFDFINLRFELDHQPLRGGAVDYFSLPFTSKTYSAVTLLHSSYLKCLRDYSRNAPEPNCLEVTSEDCECVWN